MGTTERRTAVEAIREAEGARDDLREALTGAGIVLPSLGLDALSLASDGLPPLVDLGRCHSSAARKLAAALRGAVGER